MPKEGGENKKRKQKQNPFKKNLHLPKDHDSKTGKLEKTKDPGLNKTP